MPVVALRVIVGLNVVPLSVLALYITCLSPLDVLLSHQVKITFFSSAAISGSSDSPVLLLMFIGLLKLFLDLQTIIKQLSYYIILLVRN